jgi:hypothetical protein
VNNTLISRAYGCDFSEHAKMSTIKLKSGLYKDYPNMRLLASFLEV